METPRYSFVIPVYNEEDVLPELVERLTAVLEKLDGPAEVIFVDDGSGDQTYALLASYRDRDPRFKLLRFSRNFGHQIAITAGIDHAAGDAVIVMDGDLQDPPEVALDFVERWRQGYEIVYGVRDDRSVDPAAKRVTAGLFYRLLRKLSDVEVPLDAGDFRLVDRRAADQFRALRESNRYVRGMFSWIGFRQIGVPFKRDARFAGTTKYPFRRSLKLGIDGVLSFSNVPLRLALAIGFVVSGISFVVGIFAVVAKAVGAFVVPGWASIVVGMSFLGGVQLIVIGMMGLYVARIYEEVRSRPLYVLSDAEGFAPPLEQRAPEPVRERI